MKYEFKIVDGPLAGQTAEIDKPDDQGWEYFAKWISWEYGDGELIQHIYRIKDGEIKFVQTKINTKGVKKMFDETNTY